MTQKTASLYDALDDAFDDAFEAAMAVRERWEEENAELLEQEAENNPKLNCVAEFMDIPNPARLLQTYRISRHRVVLYLQRQNWVHQGVETPLLRIARVEIDRRYRNKGLFTRLLEETEAAAAERGWAVMVEAIIAKRLAAFLRRRGYVEDRGDPRTLILWPRFAAIGGS